MKITLDIPDGTVAAFFNYVRVADRFDFDGYSIPNFSMESHSIQTDELYDGAEIKIEAGPTKAEEKK